NEMILAWSGSAMRIGDSDAADAQVTLGPLPVQQPHPPIWIAAFGPKALTQAGRLGLPYLASPMETLAELQDNLAVYTKSYAATWSGAAQQASGQLAGQATIPVMRSVFVSDDATAVATVRDALSKTRGGPAGNMPAPADAWALIGDRHEVADLIAQYRETLGMTHLIASRPRVSGLASEQLEQSLAALRRICGP
ncbi:MAG: LLM class flavin-dependent oxidoreductase, partial [Pseudomonadales bacterium]